MTKRPTRPRFDPRFKLHQRQPRADKLDARQRAICQTDEAFREALGRRVSNSQRFLAFLEGLPQYIDPERPCPRCGGFRRRTRDRSCYKCHLAGSGPNFERIKAGLAPVKKRSRDSHLDLLARQKATRLGECVDKEFGAIKVRRWPTGRLEVWYPSGQYEADLNQRSGQEVWNAMERYTDLRDALVWAGWY
jgi:hypothetical protein